MAERKKRAEGGGGAPEWVVTYGDMMSLLLTFFILLLSFSSVNQEDFNEAMGSVQGALGVLNKMTGLVSYKPPVAKANKEQQSNAARQLRRRLQVRGLEKQVKVEYDALGGIKISLPESVLFDAGTATLRPSVGPLLREFGEVLAELTDSFIEVRGHTDNTPVASTGPFTNNYDLSYARARAVMLRLVADGGVPERQFEVTACAENQPVSMNTTEEGRRMNRRVELFVRGLVNKRTMDALEQGELPEGAIEAPKELPLSPVELDELR